MKIGWVGTGVMGGPMAGHLLRAGYELTVYTRTRSKADALLQRGARWSNTPAGVAEQAEAVFMMVGTPADVEETALGQDGILRTLPAGSVLVDCTTSRPELAQRLARAAEARNVASLDAPVSGGDAGARNASLSFMVGGDRSAFERIRPLFDCMGTTVVLQGGPGAGQHTKMVNQTLVASVMIGLCEALLYAERSGLDPLTVLRSVGGGAASSWALTQLWPRMIDGDFEPGFYVDHFIKDLEIALKEAERMGLHLPGLALARELYKRTAQAGFRRKGTQALLGALRGMQALPDGEFPS